MQQLTAIPFRTVVMFSLGTVFALLIAAFVIFQARYLLLGPQLYIEPVSSGVQNERQITIAGNARNISRLWLNGRQIYTDQTGMFKEAVILENGYTMVTIRAEDRYGRTTAIEQPLTYVPASVIN